MEIRISPELAAYCHTTPERTAWLGDLPDTVQALERSWNLTPDGVLEGEAAGCSYVAAVRTPNGTPAVLKIGVPHMEAAHESAGLRFWNGNPTVHLLASDDEHGAMLLERCEPGTTLRSLEERQQDVVISGLLGRLWHPPPPPHPFRHLSALLEHWSNETLAQAEHWPDAGLVREGLRLFKELPGSATQEVLLASDLHAGNVLRAKREPWLVIDPKPFVGDPAYDATQHLFNCRTRLKSHPDETIRRLAGLLSVDHQRVRVWTFARAAAEPRENWLQTDQVELARAIAP